jgi:DNA invertase Pin-like site-specific DNA recombinase
MLTMLSGLAEFERELIRVRTGEGRWRAVANGVKMASQSSPRIRSRKPYAAAKRASLCAIARSYNVSHSTISRLEA